MCERFASNFPKKQMNFGSNFPKISHGFASNFSKILYKNLIYIYLTKQKIRLPDTVFFQQKGL